MKECLSCQIKVGGTLTQCPLCQNSLTGSDSPDLWPPITKFKKKAFWYKLQLFVLLAFSAICLVLDFLMDIHGALHWSLPVALWLITFEAMFSHNLRKKQVLASTLTVNVLVVAILLTATGWYLGFLHFVVYWFIPIMIGLLLIFVFFLSLLDKNDNVMVYLLISIVICVISYSVLRVLRHNTNLPWSICLIISIVTFIGTAVFKGRQMLSEIQRRMNF